MGRNWEAMLETLAAFKQEHGHCRVPTNDPKHLQIGRWVSAQRYKHSIGELQPERVAALEKLGFVWSASGKVWESMFRDLEAYRAANGTTNVPERCQEHQKLASWVHSQRHRKRQGIMDPAREKRLNAIGFQWTSGEACGSDLPAGFPVDAGDSSGANGSNGEGERLYLVKGGSFIQYDGKGRKPRALVKFMEIHDGESPPHILLPRERVAFFLGNRFQGQRRLVWGGQGPLPEAVMQYVQENRSLPQYEPLQDDEPVT